MLKFDSLEDINVFTGAVKYYSICSEPRIKLYLTHLSLLSFFNFVIDRKRYHSTEIFFLKGLSMSIPHKISQAT